MFLSSIVAPVAPEITSVEYFNSLLYISWIYGDDTTDLSHSRMLHWMVVAEGKKKIKKSVCFFESQYWAPDIYLHILLKIMKQTFTETLNKCLHAD